jgi:aspartate/methionine/tyrosine aminotransferase
MFLWGKVPAGMIMETEDGVTPCQKLSDRILYEAGVFITPGFIFGKNGEDYVRISLCAKPQVLKQAFERICKIM